MNPIIPLIFIIFFIGVIWYSHVQKEKRHAAMAAIATEMGLDIYETDPFGLGKQLVIFKLFSSYLFNWTHQITNVIPGEMEGIEVFLFDYSYDKSGERYRQIIRQTVFVARIEALDVPDFQFRHDRWYEAKLISRHRKPNNREIDYTSRLVPANETIETARESLVSELKPLLTRLYPAQIEASGGYLLIYRPAQLLWPDTAQVFYEDCCAILPLLQSKQKQRSLFQWAEMKGRDY
jgi:hypothetical protein